METAPTEDCPSHALIFLEMAFRSDRHQVFTDAGGIGEHTGVCGDGVTFFIRFRANLLAQVAFELHGCLNTNACANAVAEIAEGRSLAEAWNITPELVAHYLQSLPAENFHCAQIAVEAFRHALAHYQRQGAKPWKGSYR